MCTFVNSFLLDDDNCSEAGSVLNAYIMRKADFQQMTKVYATSGVNRGKYTSLTNIPPASLFRVEIQSSQPNSLRAAQANVKAKSYEQTLNLTRTGIGDRTRELLFDTQDCCNLVIFVERPNGDVFTIGVDAPSASGQDTFSDLRLQLTEATTGDTRDTVPTSSLSFNAGDGRTNVPFIALAPAAITQLFAPANIAA